MSYAEQDVRDYLQTYPRKTITLDNLQRSFSYMQYEEFYEIIQKLIQNGILQEIAAGGRDFRGLPRRLRLHVGALSDSVDAVQADAIRLQLSSQIDLSAYYARPVTEWQTDLPYIRKLSAWLKKNGRDAVPVSDQKRSWEIFHDEKYLLRNGKKLLKRLHLSSDSLHIIGEHEPLMMAVNPLALQGAVCHHLVVENKAPYHDLLTFLPQTGFSSLIFGYGWKITNNLKDLPVQIGRMDAKHIVWYFGDFDWEGLKIWCSAATHSTGVVVKLAIPFYLAFLSYQAPTGKENQKMDEDAWHFFEQAMGQLQSARFAEILANSGYYPQEILTSEELVLCWKELAHDIGTLC